MQSISHYQSPLGQMTLVSDEEALIGLWFDDQMDAGAMHLTAGSKGESDFLKRCRNDLDRYFRGEKRTLDFPIILQGTAYQKLIWQYVMQIPYGQTMTYGDIAGRMAQDGHPTSPRAVGQAVGRNRLLLVVPCHRVVAARGLGGYAAGLERKKALLKLEGSIRTHEEKAG